MAANKGWICLYRDIQDSWVWDDKPFSDGQAWIDLLLTANHEDKKIKFNGKPRVIKRGQMVTSIAKLAERWGWSAGKVRRFLNILENDQMLTLECNRGGTTNGTTLTLINYEKFQGQRQTVDTTDSITNEQRSVERSNINNNYNNINNDNNKAAPAPRPFTPYKGYGDKPKQTMFHNGEQNKYDFAELERQLLERDKPQGVEL